MTMRSIRPGAFVAALYLGLTLLFTYPLVLHLASRHVGEAGGDARVYLWNLWWVKTALTRLHTDPFQTDFIFSPTGVGLALHTLAFFHGLVFIPLSLVAGDVAAANLIVLATFVASALGAYALARHLGAGRPGAFLAGLIFAFCPARLARLAGHYDLLSTEWIPLYSLALLKTIEARRFPARWLLAAVVLGAACGYTDLTYLVFLALVSVALVGLAPRGAPLPAVLARGACIALLVAAFLSPLLAEAWRDSTSWRYAPYPGSDRYLADLLAYVTPGPRQTLLGPTLGRGFDMNLTETTVFAGWLTVALGVGALLTRGLGRGRIPWITIGAGAFALSLGDTLHVGGRDTALPLIFPALQHLPVLHHLRAPSRFSILVMLSLGVLVSLAWTRWSRRFGPPRRILAVTAVAASLMAAEFLAIPIPMFAAGAPVVFQRIAAEPGDFTVVEVPGIDQVAPQIMYRQTIHGKRIFIGTAARVPVEKTSYFFGLPLVRPLIDLRRERMRLDDALDPRVTAPCPEAARFLGIRYFVIETVYESRGLVRFLEAALPTERLPGDGARVVLRVRPGALPALPTILDAGSPASRLYYESGWAPPEGEDPPARRATRRRSTLLFRRPFDGPLVVSLALTGGDGLTVEGRNRDRLLGRARLPVEGGVAWRLPPGPSEAVARVELIWSAPGARIAEVRLRRP
jgi:hypothetical protein